MTELIRVFLTETKNFFSNKRVLLSLLLGPIIMGIIMIGFTTANMKAQASPVKVYAPKEYSEIITKAGGELSTKNFEVSISAPNEFYYKIDIYGNINRVEKMESFVNNFIKEYYFSKYSVTPTITKKTVLVIGGRVKIVNAPPGSVTQTLLAIMIGVPLSMFMALLVGNEYVSTSFTSQRQKRFLDIISSYPIHRRNIVMAKVAVGILFGIISIAIFMLSMIILLALISTSIMHQTPTANTPIGITLPGWGIVLLLFNGLLTVIFMYFVSITLALRVRDPSEASITSMIVSTFLDFSTLAPVITQSFTIFKHPIVSAIIPTLIPVQVSLFSIEGNKTGAAFFTVYMVIIVVISFKLLMKTYEKSFE